MRALGVIITAVAAVLLVVMLWASGDESGDVRPARTMPDSPADATRDDAAAAVAVRRERVNPTRPAVPTGTPPPPTEGETVEEDVTGASTLDVPALLKKPVHEIKLEDATSLRDAFGHLSGLTGAPVHLDAESAAGFDAHDGLALQFSNVPGETVLNLIAQIAGIDYVVLPERIVLHAKGIEWTEDRRTIVLPPIHPDPNAPTSIAVRGRVLDADGNAFPGAALMLGGREAGRSDAAGGFALEIRPPGQELTAVAPFVQRSPVFRVQGKYGDTLETELRLGPRAGGVRVRVTSASGEPPVRAGASVTWLDPDSLATIAWEDRVERGGVEFLRVERDGAWVSDHIPPGRVAVRVTARAHAAVTTMTDVGAGRFTEVEVELTPVVLEDRLREERITFRFSDTQLPDVVRYISDTKKINIVVTPAAWEKLSPSGVSLTIDDDSLESALRALCNAAGDLTYRIKDNVVLIEPRAR